MAARVRAGRIFGATLRGLDLVLRPSRQCLGLGLLELCLADNALVRGDRPAGRSRRPRWPVRVHRALDVLAKGGVLSLRVLDGVSLHLATAGDQVHEDPEVGQEDDEYRPQRLGPTGEVLAAENVAEHDDQQPYPDEKEEKPQHGPKDLSGPERG